MSTVRKTHETGAADPFHMGDRIRKAREHTGMDRQEFAHAVGIHRETLSKYENTGHGVKRPAMLSIAMSSGVRLEWLETGELPWLNEGPENHSGPRSLVPMIGASAQVTPISEHPASVAQWIEHQFPVLAAARSSRAGGTKEHIAPVTPIRRGA